MAHPDWSSLALAQASGLLHVLDELYDRGGTGVCSCGEKHLSSLSLVLWTLAIQLLYGVSNVSFC